jgi:uncharacterized alkaline shock family protein YloU
MANPPEEPIIEFHIATSVLEAIVRGAIKGEPLVRVHQGGLGRHRPVEVQVENGACRVAVHLDAAYGEPLMPLGAGVQQRAREALERMTGLSVGGVEVVFEGVLPTLEAE